MVDQGIGSKSQKSYMEELVLLKITSGQSYKGSYNRNLQL